MRECPTCNYRNNPEHGSHCLACRIEFPRSNPYTPLPKPNQKLVVFDLDKTLYDLSRRERIAKRAGHKPGTTEWYASMNKPEHIPKDTVIPGTLEFARKLENDGFVIAYLTGRPDHLKASTRQKLKEDGFPIHRFKEDLLFLSPTVSSNLGTLATYKKGILTRLSNEFDLAFYFDDTREFREAAKSVHPRIPGIYSSIAQYTGEAPVKRNPELFTEKEEPEVVLVPIYSREPKGNFENLGMASAVVQVGRNFLKDIGEGLQDVYRAFVGGRQSMTEKRMAMAVMEMHKDLSRAAHNRGGNAICNLQLDYEYPSMDGRSGDLTLIATGDVIKMRSPPKTNPSLPSPRVGLPRKYMFQPARLKRIRQEAPSRYPGSTPHQAFYGAYDEAQDRPLFLPASHVWFEVNSVEERIQGYPTVDVYERVLRRLGQDREPAPFKTLTEEEGFYRLIGKLVPVKSNPPAGELVMINPSIYESWGGQNDLSLPDNELVIYQRYGRDNFGYVMSELGFDVRVILDFDFGEQTVNGEKLWRWEDEAIDGTQSGGSEAIYFKGERLPGGRVELFNKVINKELLRRNPQKLLVFVDDVKRSNVGYVGKIRDEPNAVGIRLLKSLRTYKTLGKKDDTKETMSNIKADFKSAIRASKKIKADTILFLNVENIIGDRMRNSDATGTKFYRWLTGYKGGSLAEAVGRSYLEARLVGWGKREKTRSNPPPMPRKKRNKAGNMIKEPVEKYLQRFMGNPKMVEEFPDNAQRFVVGLSYARKFYGESTVNKHYPPIRTNPGVSVADAKKMYQQFHQKNPSKVEKKTMNIGETWIGLGKAWSIGYRSGKETGDENQKYIHNFGVDEESGKKFKEPELFYVPGEGGSEDLLIITGGDWYIDVDADGKVSWIYI